MECPESWDKYKNSSVFQLITRLCEKTVDEYEITEDFGQFNKQLVKKIRSHAYGILLKKSTIPPSTPCDPVMDMISEYYIRDSRKKNIGDYDCVVSIKNKIDWLFERDRSNEEEHFTDIMACVVSLRNSVPISYRQTMFENPFTFGKINEILPTATQVNEYDPVPYQYFPPHIFQLPYTIDENTNTKTKHDTNTMYNFPVEAFTSKPGTNLRYLSKTNITDDELSNTGSLTKVANISPPNVASQQDNVVAFPRLTGPRDLFIPKDIPSVAKKKHDLRSQTGIQTVKSTIIDQDAQQDNMISGSTSIWDFAHCCNSDVNMEIWEEASKLPPVIKQPLISSSVMQMNNWKLTHQNQFKRLHVISGVQFLLHIKYLVMGIESSSFPFNQSLEKFQMKDNLCLEGMLQTSLKIYVADLLVAGDCYWKLNKLVSFSTSASNVRHGGLVYKAMCDSIKQYLVWFRMEIDKIFGEGLTMEIKLDKRLPSLMEVIHQIKPLAGQIKTMAKIFKVYDTWENTDCTLRGVGLMAYLYNEISQITQTNMLTILYVILKTICSVYIKFIEHFIFEGELDDYFEEFFIRKDFMNDDKFNKRYWDRGFTIRNNEIVPEFLRGMARHILLCGKSLRLLKMCNPDDPLCLLLSTEYPPIKCCLNFSEIEEQQKLYDQYRTQCLYVCGDPVTFQSILVQREAEKKTFREMVSLKQAETMQKLIEERKRLTHIISSSKQRRYDALKAALEEAEAKKKQKKAQELAEDRLIRKHQEASDKLWHIKAMEEKDKINAYYSDLYKEVERRKVRSEWKIKRLQLDERRVQLLSTEKMNLKREKLELEHKAMEESDISISGDDTNQVDLEIEGDTGETEQDLEKQDDVNEEANENLINNNFSNVEVVVTDDNANADKQSNKSSESQTSLYMEALDYVSSDPNLNEKAESPEEIKHSNSETNTANDPKLCLSDIINKNTLTSSKFSKSLDIDVSPSDIINSNVSPSLKTTSFSDQDIFEKYQQRKKEALSYKHKVMAHEFAVDTNQNESEESNLPIISNFKSSQESDVNKRKALGSTLFSKEFTHTVYDSERNTKPQYNTDASRQAVLNRKKILEDEFDLGVSESRENRLKQIGNLSLDLKKCVTISQHNTQESKMSIGSTPDNYLTTPSEFQNRLDIETPSTLDVGLFGVPLSSTFTPSSSNIESDTTSNSKFSTTDGFPFPTIIEQQFVEDDKSEDVPDFPTEESNTDILDYTFFDKNDINIKSKVWNFSDDELNFSEFRPFGIKMTGDLKIQSMDIFKEHFCFENPKSPYTDIDEIINKAKDKPMTNISIGKLDDELKIDIDNVDPSMMVACLQRSIMIPLFHQMEMVNNATLKYFLVNCELYDHLKSLCDYFFLMDGEFAKTICSKLFEKLNVTDSPRELLNFATLHSILDKSFGSSIGGSNKYAENLSFIISDMPLSFSHSSPDVLECLSLSYSIVWPVNIILSKDALDRYAKVFRFLVKMRRISWVLEQDLEVLKMSMKEEFMVAQDMVRSPQYHTIQLYRYMMSCLIRALHSYVVNTCIKSSWTEFEKDLLQVRTLDDLYMVHVTYIKKVLFRCLLNKRSTPVMKILNDIFTVVLRFHHLLNARCWHIADEDVHYTHPFFPQMKELFITFEKLAKHLHKMTVRLSECGYQTHLTELATLININGYLNY